MQSHVKDFIARLHTRGLKPRGFTKRRNTFSRKHATYVECFQLQGSAWNHGEDPTWRFYLNAGIYFPDLVGLRAPGFAGTHVYGRLRAFDAGCIDELDLRPGDAEHTVDDVVANVERASRSMAQKLQQLRAAAEKGRFIANIALEQ